FGLGGQVHEHEPGPDVAVHGHQPELARVEVEELAVLLDQRQRSVEGVAPAVVPTGELAAEALGLLVGGVVPHQLVAAVTTDIVERPYLPALAPHDNHCRVGGGDLPGEATAGAGEWLDAADAQTRPLEDRFP